MAERLLRWDCPECSYVSWWLGESGQEEADVLAELLECDVEQHEREAHGIEEAA
jgi:hypothetical protein